MWIDTLVDGSINPAGPMIGAAAYTNSIPMAPSTALYDIDVAAQKQKLAPAARQKVAAGGGWFR